VLHLKDLALLEWELVSFGVEEGQKTKAAEGLPRICELTKITNPKYTTNPVFVNRDLWFFLTAGRRI